MVSYHIMNNMSFLRAVYVFNPNVKWFFLIFHYAIFRKEIVLRNAYYQLMNLI